MTFEKLSAIMVDELGTDKLSDIAVEFDVSPQVVSNWKSRNQVPYKYIRILREKLESGTAKNIESEQMNPAFYDFFDSSSKKEDEDIIKILAPFLKICIDNYIKIISITILFSLSSYLYEKFVKTPVFTSVTKIVPISVSKQSSQLTSLASSFGIDVGNVSRTSGLTSAEMFPALIKSRSLMESLLTRKFDTQEHGKNRTLISILLNSVKDHENWSYKQKTRAVDRLERMISVSTQRRSPLLTINAVTKEPGFSANLLNVVIDQLVLKARMHKIESVKQTIEFIQGRLSEVKIELLGKEDALKVFTESNRNIGDSPTLLLERERMSRDLEVTSSLYGSLIREYENVKIEESKLETYFEILDPPEIPNNPSNINVTRTVLQYSIFGFFMSLMIIFSVDTFRKKRVELAALFR